MARSLASASSQYLGRTSVPTTSMPLTFHARVKFTSFPSNPWLVSFTDTTDTAWYSLTPVASGGLRVQHFDGTTTGTATTANNVTTGTWHSCVGVFKDVNDRSVYLDGSVANKGTNATNVSGSMASLNRFNIGAYVGSSNGSFVNGQMAEVAVWSVALDEDEIVALSKGVSPLLIRPTSLIGYWPLLNSGAPDVDRWKDRLDFTPNGSPTMADHPLVFMPAGPFMPQFATSYSLAGDVGAYAITGVAASLKYARRLSAAIGSYAITGVAAALKRAAKTTTVVGSYAINGVAATLIKGKVLTLAVGSYAITGTAPTLRKTWKLAAAIGSYAITGVVAALRKTKPSTITVAIDGTDYTPLIDTSTIRKEETNDLIKSNTCTFRIERGSPPTELDEITVTRGISAIEFAGTVLKVKQQYDKIRHNIFWDIVCQDFTWLFNDERYTYKWAGAVSASTIAAAIVNFKAGFTTTNIEASLATVTDFEIINKTRGEALKLLAEQVGASVVKVDYTLDVHFRVTPTLVSLPSDITDVTKSGDELLRDADYGQLRTRQRGLGVRVRVPFFVPAGSTAVPVDSIDRLPASGTLLVGSRELAFTAQSQTQSVSGIAGTLAAPTVALASSPAGGVLGAVRYCITAETPDGETPLGTQSSQVTGSTIAAPSTANAIAQHQLGGSVSSGDWTYSAGLTFSRSGTRFSFSFDAVPGTRICIFASSSGAFDGTWTISEVVSTTCYVDGISSSAPASDTGNLQVITDGPLAGGTYSYKTAWLSSLGISALSSAFTLTPSAASATTSASAAGTTGGALTLLSSYTYFYTAYTESAEASPLALLASAHSLTGANNAITLTINQLANTTGWHDGRIRGLRLYRGRAGEALPRLIADFSRSALVARGAFSANWTYTDTTADTSLGGLPGSGVLGAAIGIKSLPTWTDARVTGLMVLRTVNGGSTYYPVGTISSSSIEGFLDTMSDAELLQQSAAPTTSFGGHSVTLTSIATAVGATARNIYRLFSGVWRYCGTIPDNTTTTFTDDKADDELGQPFKVAGFLTGLSATATDIPAGEVGRLYVVRNNTSAQATVAAAMGRGNGVFDGPVIDNDDLESAPLTAACDDALDTFAAKLESVNFRSRDVNLQPGKTITFALGSTTNISGTFLIQRVVTSEMDIADGLNPMRQVTAGPVLTSYRKALAA